MEESVGKKEKSPQPVNEIPCSKKEGETLETSKDKLLKEPSTSPTKKLPNKLSATAVANIKQMKQEFANRRKIIVANLPAGGEKNAKQLLNELLGNDKFDIISSNYRDNSYKVILHKSELAKDALLTINGSKRGRISAQYGHSDSLLFVGNLPSNYTNEQLRELFSLHGQVLRCFVVYSMLTGESKGYGFVEYSTRDEAMFTKNKMATKVVGSRSIRVDFADNGMQTDEDLQSKTVFVDKLPKGFKSESRLIELFSKYGTVNFCQIAMLPNGCPRGFAFVDMSSSEGAEAVQTNCNGHIIDGQEIRVSYGMPCRPGACILQPRNNTPHVASWNIKIMPVNVMGPHNIPGTHGPSNFLGPPEFSGPPNYPGLIDYQGPPNYPGPPDYPTCNYPGPPDHPNFPGPPDHPNFPGPPDHPNFSGPSDYPNYPGPPDHPNFSGPPDYPNYPGPSDYPNFSGPPNISSHSVAVMPADSTVVSFAGKGPVYHSRTRRVPSPLYVSSHIPFAGVPPHAHTTNEQDTQENNPCQSNYQDEKENQPTPKADKPIVGQKRRFVDDHELTGVYDKPYIGQHDQGIAFQHPLKRIKKNH